MDDPRHLRRRDHPRLSGLSGGDRDPGTEARALRCALQDGSDDVDQAVVQLDDVSLRLCHEAGSGRRARIDIAREGFEWALRNAALSHFTPEAYASPEVWRAAVDQTPVRIQWDPERDWRLNPIAGVRSFQVGLSGDAVSHYVHRWIVGIADITPVARLAAQAAASGAVPPALPGDGERSYPLAIRASGLLQP